MMFEIRYVLSEYGLSIVEDAFYEDTFLINLGYIAGNYLYGEQWYEDFVEIMCGCYLDIVEILNNKDELIKEGIIEEVCCL